MGDTPADAIGNTHAEHKSPVLIALQGAVLDRGARPEPLEPGQGAGKPVYNLLPGGFEPCKQIVDDALAPTGRGFHQIIPLVGYPLDDETDDDVQLILKFAEPGENPIDDIGNDGAAHEHLPQPLEEAHDRIDKPLDLIVYPGGGKEYGSHQCREDADRQQDRADDEQDRGSHENQGCHQDNPDNLC